jgi:threonine dehydrogenase-like Zn-dependent dehydrogenase
VLGIVRHPGAMAEYLTLPERNLFAVPPEIPLELAAFTEPIAAACEILDQISIPHDAPVAILGDGKLGLLIAQVLRAHGAKVKLFGRHKEKLRIVEPAGVETELCGKKLPVAAYDWVVDATGSAEGLQQAIRMTRPRGALIMKSTVHGMVSLDTAAVIVNEITLVGSRCGRFEPALRLLREGTLRLSPMISETLPLSEAPRAFELAAKKGTLKIQLTA